MELDGEPRAEALLATHGAPVSHLAVVSSDAGVTPQACLRASLPCTAQRGPEHCGNTGESKTRHLLLSVDAAGLCSVWEEPEGCCVLRQHVPALATTRATFADVPLVSLSSRSLHVQLTRYVARADGAFRRRPTQDDDPLSSWQLLAVVPGRNAASPRSLASTVGPQLNGGNVFESPGAQTSTPQLVPQAGLAACCVQAYHAGPGGYELLSSAPMPLLPLQQLVAAASPAAAREVDWAAGSAADGVPAGDAQVHEPQPHRPATLAQRVYVMRVPEAPSAAVQAGAPGRLAAVVLAINPHGALHGCALARDGRSLPPCELGPSEPLGWVVGDAACGAGGPAAGGVACAPAQLPGGLAAAALSDELQWAVLGSPEAWLVLRTSHSWRWHAEAGLAAGPPGATARLRCVLRVAFTPVQLLSLMHHGPAWPLPTARVAPTGVDAAHGPGPGSAGGAVPPRSGPALRAASRLMALPCAAAPPPGAAQAGLTAAHGDGEGGLGPGLGLVAWGAAGAAQLVLLGGTGGLREVRDLALQPTWHLSRPDLALEPRCDAGAGAPASGWVAACAVPRSVGSVGPRSGPGRVLLASCRRERAWRVGPWLASCALASWRLPSAQQRAAQALRDVRLAGEGRLWDCWAAAEPDSERRGGGEGASLGGRLPPHARVAAGPAPRRALWRDADAGSSGRSSCDGGSGFSGSDWGDAGSSAGSGTDAEAEAEVGAGCASEADAPLRGGASGAVAGCGEAAGAARSAGNGAPGGLLDGVRRRLGSGLRRGRMRAAPPRWLHERAAGRRADGEGLTVSLYGKAEPPAGPWEVGCDAEPAPAEQEALGGASGASGAAADAAVLTTSLACCEPPAAGPSGAPGEAFVLHGTAAGDLLFCEAAAYAVPGAAAAAWQRARGGARGGAAAAVGAWAAERAGVMAGHVGAVTCQVRVPIRPQTQ
jgi:hypothetical protein